MTQKLIAFIGAMRAMARHASDKRRLSRWHRERQSRRGR